MPLRDENRIIAKHGLERLADTKKVGIQALKANAGITGPLRTYDVGYKLGPRINAVGRIDDSALALRLLLTADPAEAKAMADEIEVVNTDRREHQQKMIEEAIGMVESRHLQDRSVIVVANAEWHAGIVGLVAGRLAERYYRPTFCFIIDEERGLCKGSARSIPNFSVVDAIRAYPELLEGGGHTMAAGCAFQASRLAEVEEALNAYADSVLTPEDFVVAYQADLEVDPTSLSMSVMESIALLEPFGESNPEPTMVARGIDLAQITPTKNPAHVQLTFRAGGTSSISGVGFSMGERFTDTRVGSRIDVLFQPKIDDFNGRRVKWHLKDFLEA